MNHVCTDRVHDCVNAHGRVSAEEAWLFGPGHGKPARYLSYSQDD
jgi:hypothetical protein